VQRLLRGVVILGMGSVWTMVVPGGAYGATAGSDGPGGTVSVGATDGGSSNGGPPGSAGGGGPGQGGSPWSCTSLRLALNNDGGFAPGGPTPGSWYSVTCTNRLSGATTIQTEWIPDQSPATTMPGVDPYALALQAENSLQLPKPSSHFNPSAASTVNLPTWLWTDAGMWHSYTVTASVGLVSATAVAMPVSIVWSMGDGTVVSCAGPGRPFNPAQPSSGQATDCAHTYSTSSAGQRSTDGNPNDGAFEVRATVMWSVSWSARGAAGGGLLPTLFTSASTPVRVEQVESINDVAVAAGRIHLVPRLMR
jgi:hypothetical protein